ncbi:MAG TPA: hypothetical protein VLX44_02075 [Xanthobacteraceae bacterium]|nr:hypothetical protein [Xanthobacteraceae bacterium]
MMDEVAIDGDVMTLAAEGRRLDMQRRDALARRPHSSLDGMTPDQAYFTPLPLRLAA